MIGRPKRNIDTLSMVYSYIVQFGPVKIDDLALEFRVSRRTAQYYVHDIKKLWPGIVSIPGKSGGVLYSAVK